MGARIHACIWVSPVTVHLKLKILSISYTPIQNKVVWFFFLIVDCGKQEANRHSLQRKQGAELRRKETGSEENYGHTCSFLKNYIDVWLIFSVVLSSAALQCDTHKKCVIHIKILFLILFHVIYH